MKKTGILLLFAVSVLVMVMFISGCGSEKEDSYDYMEGVYTVYIKGDNSDLFGSPDGIFYGENYALRGRDSEKEVTVTIMDPDGRTIIRQTCGIRIYGGASRESYLKSVKLYAREEYDEENKQFSYDFFGTKKQDGSNETIDSYKRLVIRNCGNDFQFAWIRDELVQRLAARAGYLYTEAVAPVVMYINSEYRGLYWLHESYCDYYFKSKFGKDGRDGEFVVLEGSETRKNVEDDEGLERDAANEFNLAYEYLSSLDMTVERNYSELCDFMDVENYLEYYAINVYVNNRDWPWNNYKCFRYYAQTDEEYAESGVYDGRWRFLLHDTDFSLGLYDQRETQASYDSLARLMDSSNTEGDFANYSPLFTKLMERDDCRQYFIDYTLELMNGAFSEENMLSMLQVMNDGRAEAMERFISYIESLRRQGASGMWAGSEHQEDQLDKIKKFIAQRAEYSLKYLRQDLGAE